MLLDGGSGLLEGTVGSVWDSHQEILGWGAASIFVVNHLGTVDENDAEVLLECCVVLVALLERVELLGNLFFELSWLLLVFLDYLFSFIEHVCYTC